MKQLRRRTDPPGQRRTPAAAWPAWLVWGLGGWFFMYADRAVLSPSLHAIGLQFGANTAELGLIAAVFFASYTALQLPVGWFADRFNPGWLMTAGIIGFGAFTAAMGLASNFSALLAFSALAGMFQGTFYPTQFAIASRVIPQATRTTANSIINSGMGAGIGAGFIWAAWAQQSTVGTIGQWRLPFLLLGAATIIWAGLGARTAVQFGRQPAWPTRQLPHLLPQERKPLLRLSLANFTSLFGFFFMLTWLPYYLQTALHIHGIQSGVIPALAPLTSIPAAILWSRAADRFQIRQSLIPACFLLAAGCMMTIPLAHQFGAILVLGLIGYGIFGKLVLDPLILTELSSQIRSETYGRAFAILNFSGMLASILAPMGAGLLLAWGWPAAINFYLAAVLLLCGAALTWPRGLLPAWRSRALSR